MEFSHGRREMFYITERDEDRPQEDASNRLNFADPSSSTMPSSSSSLVSFRWDDASAGGTGGGGEGGGEGVEKEHMFDKVVTPSDVGKLNRLVIPKQHAERYFPLDASANEKGLLLCFEDRTGKAWRFRYSYWNSSQSYVMTKGWSRFVKEKRLDAGDTVSFGRGVGEAARDRLFIDWKRRPDPREGSRFPRFPLPGVGLLSFAQSSVRPWGARFFVPPTSPMYGNNAVNSSATGGQFLHFGRPAAAPIPPQIGVQVGFSPPLPMVLDAVPVIPNQATASKRVRLFGVNLDGPEESDEGNVLTGNAVLQLLQPRAAAAAALPLLRSPPHEGAESSGASSPCQSKDHRSSLDLDL